MGFKTVIGCGQCSNDTVNISSAGNNSGNPFTAFGPVGGPICTNSWETNTPVVGTPGAVQLNNHSPHTASGMALTTGNVSNGLSNDIVHQLFVNGTAGNLILPVLSFAHNGNANYAANVVIQDASHSDAVPGSGTPLALSQGWTGTGPGSGFCLFTGVMWQADQPGGASVPLTACLGDGSGTSGHVGTPSSAIFMAVTGGLHQNPAVAQAQVCAPSAGTLSSLQINVVAPLPNIAASNVAHFLSCVSSTFGGTVTNGNVNLAIPGNVGVGILDDATGTDAVPAGFFINSQISWPFSFTVDFSALGFTWTSAQPNVAPLTSGDALAIAGNANPNNRAQIGYTLFRPGATSTLEGPAPIPTAGSFSGLNVVVSTAAASSAQAFSMVSNVSANQTFAFGATTGVFSDATHSDAMPSNGTFQTFMTNWPSTVSIASHAVAFTTPAPPVGGGGLMLMGMG